LYLTSKHVFENFGGAVAHPWLWRGFPTPGCGGGFPPLVAGLDFDILRQEFSNLKLIKTYLRSSIHQERLHSLTMMSIESEISRCLNLDKVLKDIANARHKNKFHVANTFFVS